MKGKSGGSRTDLSRFRDVRAWIFDLDNTLYPPGNGIFPQVQARVQDYVQKLLNVSPEDARRIQTDLYDRYGATLRGLIEEHKVDTDAFLEYVHDVDHSLITPDPALARAIGELPGQRYILTNGSRKHAENVAKALGFTREFHDVFDIVWSGDFPKPSPRAYERLIRHTGIDPSQAAMFEDLQRNLTAPHQLGMATVLIVPPGTGGVFGKPQQKAVSRGFGPEVDFITDDLGGFLKQVLAASP
jgi:putative hydrolase of the HAD superfamily